MTGFASDPKGAVAHLRKADPALAEVIGAVGPFDMELKASRSLFGALAEGTVYQDRKGVGEGRGGGLGGVWRVHVCPSVLDPTLAEVIGAVGPFDMELKASRSLFGALAEAIVYPQLSNKATATIERRLH